MIFTESKILYLPTKVTSHADLCTLATFLWRLREMKRISISVATEFIHYHTKDFKRCNNYSPRATQSPSFFMQREHITSQQLSHYTQKRQESNDHSVWVLCERVRRAERCRSWSCASCLVLSYRLSTGRVVDIMASLHLAQCNWKGIQRGTETVTVRFTAQGPMLRLKSYDHVKLVIFSSLKLLIQQNQKSGSWVTASHRAHSPCNSSKHLPHSLTYTNSIIKSSLILLLFCIQNGYIIKRDIIHCSILKPETIHSIHSKIIIIICIIHCVFCSVHAPCHFLISP